MAKIDLSHYKDLYLKTSFDQLEQMRGGLDALSVDLGSISGRDAVYINAHTLVSKSMMLGYTEIGTVSQYIEKIFYTIKNSKFSLTEGVLEKIKLAQLQIKDALLAIQKDDTRIDLSESKSALAPFLGEKI